MDNSDYRRRFTLYAIGLAGGFVIAACLWMIVVALQTGAPTSTTQWAYDIILFKSRAANRELPPRLLLIGGSSTLFGMHARDIGSSIGLPTINYGIHGGLGIPYILYLAKHVVKPRDTVLLCFEYSSYGSGVSDVLVDYVYARDPAYLAMMPLSVHWKMPLYLSVPRVVAGLRSRNRSPEAPTMPTLGCYTKDSLNEFGDETCNVEAHKPTDLVDRLQQQLQSQRNAPTNTTEAFQSIRDFRTWAGQQHVRVLATYPATKRVQVYDDRPWKDFFQNVAGFHDEIKVPLLGTPQIFMYDDPNLFFDTLHHLTDRGARLRTEQLISLLKPYLQNHATQ